MKKNFIGLLILIAINTNAQYSTKNTSTLGESIKIATATYDSLMKLLYSNSDKVYDTSVLFNERFTQTIFDTLNNIYESHIINSIKEENEKGSPFFLKCFLTNSTSYSTGKIVGNPIRTNIQNEKSRSNSFSSVYGRIIKSIRVTRGKVEIIKTPYYIGRLNSSYESNYLNSFATVTDTIIKNKSFKNYNFFYIVSYIENITKLTVLKEVKVNIIWDTTFQAVVYKEIRKKEFTNSKSFLEISTETFEKIGSKYLLKEFSYLSPRSILINDIYPFSESLYTNISVTRDFISTEVFNQEIISKKEISPLTSWEEIDEQTTRIPIPSKAMQDGVIPIKKTLQ